MKSRLLYISKNAFVKSFKGGRELLSNQNLKIIKKIFKKNFYIYKLSNKKLSTLKQFVYSIIGHIDGINYNSLNLICNTIIKNKISVVYLDGSNLGSCAKFIKKKFPELKIVTFFHNIETKFFFDNFKKTKTIKSIIIFLINFLNELRSIIFSDYKICITIEDSNLMDKIFKNKADYISPLTMKDNYKKIKSKNKYNESYILFVGGGFYGNFHGVKWFVENVVPYIKIKTIIIGKGYKIIKEFNNQKVKFLNNIKNLNFWYKNASFVIAPIFHGSGMKTKIAEALMHGKTILGTSFSSIGYAHLKKNIFKKCENKNNFIKEINKINNKKIPLFNISSRSLYKKKYSFNSGLIILKNFFKKNKLIK